MATGTGPNSLSPSNVQWEALCRNVKEQLLEEMGEESWYLIIVSSCLCLEYCFVAAWPGYVGGKVDVSFWAIGMRSGYDGSRRWLYCHAVRTH